MLMPIIAPDPEISQVTDPIGYCCLVVHHFHYQQQHKSEGALQWSSAVTSALSLLVYVVISVSQLRAAMTTQQ